MVDIIDLINGVQKRDIHISKIKEIRVSTIKRLEQLIGELQSSEELLIGEKASYPIETINKAIAYLKNYKFLSDKSFNSKTGIEKLNQLGNYYASSMNLNIVSKLDEAMDIFNEKMNPKKVPGKKEPITKNPRELAYKKALEVITDFKEDHNKYVTALRYHKTILEDYNGADRTDIRDKIGNINKDLLDFIKQSGIKVHYKQSEWRMPIKYNEGAFSDFIMNPVLEILDIIMENPKEKTNTEDSGDKIYIRTHNMQVSGYSEAKIKKHFPPPKHSRESRIARIIFSDKDNENPEEDAKTVQNYFKDRINSAKRCMYLNEEIKKLGGVLNIYNDNGKGGRGTYICIDIPL